MLSIIDTHNITRSKFNSPTYKTQKISVFDVVSQSSNPNSMSSKTFSALQISILNVGYAMPVTVTLNPLYKENHEINLTDYQKICSVIEGNNDDAKSGIGGEAVFATQVSDEKIREYFKYELTDGQQRSSVVRLGTKYFMEDPDGEIKANDWFNGKNIPNDPGKEMLKYLAWREDFSIPCVVLKDLDDVKRMSVTVLMNQARGSHSLSSMKDIVYNLINVAGMSKEWVARNLFLDISSIDRMVQLKGLKSAFNNIDDTDLAWSPENDKSYIRKTNAYLNREASKFVTQYLEMHPDTEAGQNRDIGDIQDYATSLGWSRDDAMKVKQNDTKQIKSNTEEKNTTKE
jgi:hypothetical protein